MIKTVNNGKEIRKNDKMTTTEKLRNLFDYSIFLINYVLVTSNLYTLLLKIK